MRTIQAKELTNDNFRTYGEFYDIMSVSEESMLACSTNGEWRS